MLKIVSYLNWFAAKLTSSILGNYPEIFYKDIEGLDILSIVESKIDFSYNLLLLFLGDIELFFYPAKKCFFETHSWLACL